MWEDSAVLLGDAPPQLIQSGIQGWVASCDCRRGGLGAAPGSSLVRRVRNLKEHLKVAWKEKSIASLLNEVAENGRIVSTERLWRH
jgi:hypothetical protein